MEYVTLNNGAETPKLGYGVYQTPVQDTEECVLEAIEVGYRSIDTVQVYGNEDGMGNVLAACSLPKEELFTTTKVWIINAGYEKARRPVDESLKKLKMDYIDLSLTHQPLNDYYGTYRAMEEAYGARKVRVIGVSNFYLDRLIDLCRFVKAKPVINQVEIHVFQQQRKAREIMKRCGVQIESWGPFAGGWKGFFNSSVLNEIGSRYGKSAAQVAPYFLIQRDAVVTPKTTRRERVEENINVFDSVLADEEMEVLVGPDQGESAFLSHYNPETAEFLTGLGI